ncbi:hypothetical protein DLM45_12470 [Hyphomicrobium methylovorum]|uniref:hypothetical protein n=1 Tax=Hyphomicrobium methylovorum TaxID=84 RepID=UPI0015E7838D|nr:hypothetical protein [Hyphomicrobium methylovorum]MBA2127028.1 hypothetical protein [Hyphomicrobium methylovorum]
MSIKTLMSAAEAAGYVMAAEEELPTNFGAEPEILEFKSQPTTEIAIWRPVVPAIDGKPLSGYVAHAWDWLTDRVAGRSATAA